MSNKPTLEERAAAMRERNTPTRKSRKLAKREALRKKFEEVAGPDAQVRIEVIPAGESRDVKKLLTKMNDALKGLSSLSPEQVQEKISGLTQVLHVKLQLQVNEALDKLSSPDPLVARGALNVVESLMPFITQISELNVKMQVALGLGESKGKLVAKGQIAAPPATGDDWEKSYGDTLSNKNVN